MGVRNELATSNPALLHLINELPEPGVSVAAPEQRLLAARQISGTLAPSMVAQQFSLRLSFCAPTLDTQGPVSVQRIRNRLGE